MVVFPCDPTYPVDETAALPQTPADAGCAGTGLRRDARPHGRQSAFTSGYMRTLPTYQAAGVIRISAFITPGNSANARFRADGIWMTPSNPSPAAD